MTDWCWCYENPKKAAEEIDRLNAELAKYKAGVEVEGEYYPMSVEGDGGDYIVLDSNIFRVGQSVRVIILTGEKANRGEIDMGRRVTQHIYVCSVCGTTPIDGEYLWDMAGEYVCAVCIDREER